MTASESLTVNASPALTVTKTVNPTVAEPDDTVTYTLVCSNTGNAAASGVTLTDDPDETYVASVAGITEGGSYGGDTILWTIGDVDADSSTTVTYEATLRPASSGTFLAGSTIVGNTATVSSADTSPISDGATLTVEYTPVFATSLQIVSKDHGYVTVWTVGGTYTVPSDEKLTIPCVLDEYVTVLAVPDGGYHFKEWSGDDSELVFAKTLPDNAIIMDDDYKLETHYDSD